MRIGPYDIIGELGRGAMGVVYRARHTELERVVALKVVVPDGASAVAVARLRREAQAAARLADVPGIAGVRDVGEHDGQVWVAMDFIDGRSFDEVIADGELTTAEAVAVVAAAARSVSAAHQLGVLHRDLKPANILVAADGTPYVADFGLAQVRGADADVTRLTQSGEVLGTPAYMPPEQVTGQSCDARADVYALGATLFEALSGAPPFLSDSIHGVFLKVLREQPSLPASLVRGLPAGLEAVLLASLAKAPEDRPPTARALAEDLERVLRGEAVESRVPRAAKGAGRAIRGHPMLAAAAVLLLGAGVGLVWLNTRSGSQARELRGTEVQANEAELAAKLSGVYLDLITASGSAMARLEDRWNNVAVPPDEVDAALESVRAAADAAAADHPHVQLPHAWRVLGESLAGRSLDGIGRLQELSGRDPFPVLFAARLAVGAYVIEAPAPEVSFTERTYRSRLPLESAEVQALRLRAVELMKPLEDDPVLARLTHGGTFREFLAGAEHFSERRFAEAAEALAPLLDDPLLAGVSAPLLGLARMELQDAPGAAAAWEHERVFGWPAARNNGVLAHMAAAVEASGKGGDPREAFRAALRSADALVEMAPARPDWRHMRAQAQLALAAELVYRRQPIEELVVAAEADLRMILEAGVDRIAATTGLLQVHMLRGMAELRAGRRPMAHFQRVVDGATAALDRFPDALPLLQVRVAALDKLAESQTRWSEPTEQAWHATRAAAVRVLELDPDNSGMRLVLARAGRELASLAAARGEAPAPLFEEVVRDFDRALERATGDPEVRRERAKVFLLWAHAAHNRGEPSAELLQRGLATFDELLASEPGDFLARFERATGLQVRGEWAIERGEDPRPHFRRALADLDWLVKHEPRDVDNLGNRALVWKTYAEWELTQGGAGAESLAAANADLDRVLRLEPDNLLGLHARGSLASTLGALAEARGEDPAPHEARALEDFERAVTAHPSSAATYYNRARLWDRQASRRRAANRDPRPLLRKAIADYGKAVECDGSLAVAWQNRAVMWTELGEIDDLVGGDGGPAYAAALEDSANALALNPRSLYGRINRASLLRVIGDRDVKRGGDGTPRYRAALDDCAVALEISPDAWEPRVIRGLTLTRLGSHDEAIAELTAAKAGAPAGSVDGFLKAARAAKLAAGGR